RRALAYLGVPFAIQRWVNCFFYDAVDLAALRPDVAQIHRTALAILAERLGREIDQHAAGKRVGNDERRRGEEARAHRRMDAAFEIAIAGEDRDGGQPVGADRLVHLGRQRPGIAHAGHAAEARRLETERVERFLQAALRE